MASRSRQSRRAFLKTATLATAGLWWTSCATRRRSDGGGFRFIHYTDSHIRPEYDVPRAVAQSLREAVRFEPDLILAGGDLITDGYTSDAATAKERFQIFRDALRPYSVPVRYCLGNHDVVAVEPPPGTPAATDPKAVFREVTGQERTYFSFDHGGWHFVVLDSVCIPNDHGLKYIGHVDEAQLAWLEADLQRAGERTPIVVVTHLPLLTVFFQREKGTTEPAPADRIVVNGTEVMRLLSRHNTKLVLQGHLHIQERIEYRGMTFITGGAVCGKWWRGSYYGCPEGFGVVTCRAEGFQYEYRTYGWEARRP